MVRGTGREAADLPRRRGQPARLIAKARHCLVETQGPLAVPELVTPQSGISVGPAIDECLVLLVGDLELVDAECRKINGLDRFEAGEIDPQVPFRHGYRSRARRLQSDRDRPRLIRRVIGADAQEHGFRGAEAGLLHPHPERPVPVRVVPAPVIGPARPTPGCQPRPSGNSRRRHPASWSRK